MHRLQLTVVGMYSGSGAAPRKFHFAIGGIMSLQLMLDLKIADQQIVRRTSLMGWFFMPRMVGILVNPDKNMSEDRHPIHMRDVEPMANGQSAHRGPHVDEISGHISGSKTDWANAGCVRPRAKIAPIRPVRICVLRRR